MAAVSLGRMKAKGLVPELRRLYQDERVSPDVRGACAWALGQITGEPVPPPKVPVEARERWYGGWFLEPLGNPP